MKIPKTFKLLGATYNVSYDDKIESSDGHVGQFLCRTHRIKVLKDKVANQTFREQTFTHELVHAILNAMDSKMFNDEQFVEQFGRLLHQYTVTKEGDLDEDSNTDSDTPAERVRNKRGKAQDEYDRGRHA